MSDYLDWEDLVEDDGALPEPQEDRPALNDLLSRDDIPDELKELLKTRQELEDQLKSFSLGQNNEPEQDARDKKRFPVKAHTVESRLEEKRQKKIDEHRRTAEIRYREKLAQQRKDAIKRFEALELNKREELARKKRELSQVEEREQRRQQWRRESELKRQQQDSWLAQRRIQQQENILADKRQRLIEETLMLKRRERSTEKRLQSIREAEHWSQRADNRLAEASEKILRQQFEQRRIEQKHELFAQRLKKRLAKDALSARRSNENDFEKQLNARNEMAEYKARQRQRQKQLEEDALNAREHMRLQRVNERCAETLREKQQERRAEERRLNRDIGTSDRYE